MHLPTLPWRYPRIFSWVVSVRLRDRRYGMLPGERKVTPDQGSEKGFQD